MQLPLSATSSAIGLAACLAIAASSAQAQVTVRMTTAQQASCNATTDASGLTLVPGSTDLQATGVVLTGDGCGTSGANFQAALSIAPTSVVAGSPATVTWSAGQPATRCMYTGTPGLSGWAVGTVACQGASCAQPHTNTVTPTSANTYDISVTCTNDSGFRQGTLTATTPPSAPQPPNFALTPNPASTTVNTDFQVSWSVTGATKCTGTAKRDGSPLSSLSGWTDVITPSSPRTVRAAQSGTYTLQLTCENNNGAVTSQEANVVVSPQVGACSVPGLTRKVAGKIGYPTLGSNPSNPPSRSNVDLTLFQNIWGYESNTDTSVPWPGKNSVPAVWGWMKNEFIAAKLTAPSNTSPKSSLTYATYFSGPALTIAVSQTCGDFSPSDPRCVHEGVTTGNELIRTVVSPYTNGCPMTPGSEYYVNIKFTNPDQAGTSAYNLSFTNGVSSQ